MPNIGWRTVSVWAAVRRIAVKHDSVCDSGWRRMLSAHLPCLFLLRGQWWGIRLFVALASKWRSPSRPCAWQPCRVNGVHFLPKFRLRSLQIGSPGACDLEFPVVNLSAFVHVQLVDELDLSRSVPAISILGALAQIVRRNSLVVQSDLDFAAFVSCPVSDNR